MIRGLAETISHEQATLAQNAKEHKTEFEQAAIQVSSGICEQIEHTLIKSIAHEQIEKAKSARQSARSFSEGAK